MLSYRLNKRHYRTTANMDQMSEYTEMMANLSSELRLSSNPDVTDPLWAEGNSAFPSSRDMTMASIMTC